MDLFKELIPSLTSTKNYLFSSEADVEALEGEYNAFMVNRALSQYMDTVIQANEMNINYNLDPKLQYDYLFHSVTKGKRFAKWAKATKDDRIELVVKAYNVSPKRAEEMAVILTEKDFEMIAAYLEEGGKR